MGNARIPRALAPRRPKQKTGLRPAHLAFVRSLPCVACGKDPPCHAAHIRMSNAEHGKANAMGAKPPDRFAAPLCDKCHLEDQHSRDGERVFWGRLGIDPLDLAARLWAVSGNIEEGRRAVFRARQLILIKAGGHNG